jgi:hypothetical protein
MEFHEIFRALPKGYTTHIALLLRVLDGSTGDVVELGGGAFSTPLLHWYCKNKGRNLISYEDNYDFYLFEKQFQSNHHKIVLVKDWGEVDATTHRGVVFIDHGGRAVSGTWHGYRRGMDAIRFKDSADYVVLHDTEPKHWKTYGYEEVWKQFKYRFDWIECVPYTSVVSNLYPVDGFK